MDGYPKECVGVGTGAKISDSHTAVSNTDRTVTDEAIRNSVNECEEPVKMNEEADNLVDSEEDDVVEDNCAELSDGCEPSSATSVIVHDGFIALHIGAGRHSRMLHGRYRRLVGRACREGVRLLRAGATAMDAVEAATALLENSPMTNAGRGSSLTVAGRVEADASVMCGRSLRWAGVAAVPGVRNPVTVARKLADGLDTEQPLGRIPPCLLVGIGARRWAKEHGLDVVAGKHLIAEKSLKSYKKYKARLDQLSGRNILTAVRRLDTVGVVAVDSAGDVAAACSSGGIALKVPGRAGQAAVYGSGAWAENGAPSVAVTTSGCGEHLVRSGLAQRVAAEVPTAPHPTAALHAAMQRHFLESKFLRDVATPLGGVLYLQHSPADGGGELLWAHTTATMCVGFMGTGDRRPSAAVSALPPSISPGKGVVAHGTCFRTRPQPKPSS